MNMYTSMKYRKSRIEKWRAEFYEETPCWRYTCHCAPSRIVGRFCAPTSWAVRNPGIVIVKCRALGNKLWRAITLTHYPQPRHRGLSPTHDRPGVEDAYPEQRVSAFRRLPSGSPPVGRSARFECRPAPPHPPNPHPRRKTAGWEPPRSQLLRRHRFLRSKWGKRIKYKSSWYYCGPLRLDFQQVRVSFYLAIFYVVSGTRNFFLLWS